MKYTNKKSTRENRIRNLLTCTKDLSKYCFWMFDIDIVRRFALSIRPIKQLAVFRISQQYLNNCLGSRAHCYVKYRVPFFIARRDLGLFV